MIIATRSDPVRAETAPMSNGPKAAPARISTFRIAKPAPRRAAGITSAAAAAVLGVESMRVNAPAATISTCRARTGTSMPAIGISPPVSRLKPTIVV